MRFLGLLEEPGCGVFASSFLETRRARRESGRSLKISEAGFSDVRGGRLDLGFCAAFV